jgi:hypothetical protein
MAMGVLTRGGMFRDIKGKTGDPEEEEGRLAGHTGGR